MKPSTEHRQSRANYRSDSKIAGNRKSADEARSCRSAEFSGCCSWNDGVLDYYKGICHSKLDSPRCDTKWDVSLQGRCSGKGGVLRVKANGAVLCVKGGESKPRIPKCNK